MTGGTTGSRTPARRSPSGDARRRTALLITGLVALAALAAACSSGDDDAATTTAPSTTTPLTTPTMPSAEDGQGTPLSVAWVRLVGGTGDDELRGVAGKDADVVAVGATRGLTAPDPATTKALVTLVKGEDGSIVASGEAGTDGTTTADAVGAAAESDRVVVCGATDGTFGGTRFGATDAWCGSVGEAADVTGVGRAGGDEEDRLDAVAVSSDGALAYAAGATSSLFPGAEDPTGGVIGAGDALVVQLGSGTTPGWASQFGTAAPDRAEGASTSDDGDAIVAGTTEGTTDAPSTDDGASGASDGWIARMDPYGNQRWLLQFGTTGADTAHAVAVGGDPRRGTETFVAVGSTTGTTTSATARNSGGADAMVTAVNASGKQVWTTQFGSAADDSATGAVMDGSVVYVTGTTDGTIEGAERIPLVPTPDDEAGGAASTTAPSTTAPSTTAPQQTGRDAFLAAVDASTGEVMWVATFGSDVDDQVTGATRTESGLLVVSGTTSGALGDQTPAGGTDGFLVAFRLPASGGGAASVV